jgi:hypothetical protein
MFITLQPKQIQYDSHTGFMWKKCAKVDELWGILIFFQKTQMKKFIAKSFKEWIFEITIFGQLVPAGHQNIAVLKFSYFPLYPVAKFG